MWCRGIVALENTDKAFHFLKAHRNLAEILTDHKLASLGDAFINFVYSLALSNKKKQPSGAKVKGHVLAEALRKAELRKYMPSRITRHMLADAAEALTVYAWLHNYITLEESVAMLEKAEDLVEGLSQLLLTIKNRIKF
jgi:hypothetical protein